MSALPYFEYFVGIHHHQFTVSDFSFLVFFFKHVAPLWMDLGRESQTLAVLLSLVVVLRSLVQFQLFQICLVLPKQKNGQEVNDKNLHSHMDSRGGVEHIDEDEAESDKKNNPGSADIFGEYFYKAKKFFSLTSFKSLYKRPGRHNVWRYEKGHPGHGNKLRRKIYQQAC